MYFNGTNLKMSFTFKLLTSFNSNVIASFKKVNLHPDHHIFFVECIIKIDVKVDVGRHVFSNASTATLKQYQASGVT